MGKMKSWRICGKPILMNKKNNRKEELEVHLHRVVEAMKTRLTDFLGWCTTTRPGHRNSKADKIRGRAWFEPATPSCWSIESGRRFHCGICRSGKMLLYYGI